MDGWREGGRESENGLTNTQNSLLFGIKMSDECIDGWMGGWIDGWMDEWMGG